MSRSSAALAFPFPSQGTERERSTEGPAEASLQMLLCFRDVGGKEFSMFPRLES